MIHDVLVVDDDLTVARVHRAYVERLEGFRVSGVVHTAADALSSVKLHRPDLVLLDVHLPDGSGLDVLRELRRDADGPDVIVLTASREVETVRAALHGGVVTYLVKPFSFGAFAERLREWQQDRAAAASDEALGQEQVDRLLAVGRRPLAPDLPKGLSAASLERVVAALREADELSAQETADATGLSRVSARRYLEHLCAVDRATVAPRYGSAGRPENRYSLSRSGPRPSAG